MAASNTASPELYTAAAETYRVQQATLRATVVRDILVLWKTLFNPNKPDESWAAIKQALALLVKDRRSTSSGLASAYYRQARQASGVTSLFTPKLAPPEIPSALLSATQDSTGIASYFRAVGNGQKPTQALDTSGTLLSGSMSRLVLDAGRTTIIDSVHADPEAIGWQRITDATPCAFCAMLTSRGPVYKSKETASFQAHDHCACMSAPAFSHDEVWLQHSRELRSQWADVTKGYSGKDALNAWRRYLNSKGNDDGE